ncbi:unnamed protein product [Auanema sp. JU1783]|nr:unnamed protein product [Auanema sp. JU1783]
MSDDSDVDNVGYESLLRNINIGKDKKAQVRKNVHSIDVQDLLGSVKVQKKSLALAKLKVENDKKKSKKKNSALPVPLHRQERERLQGQVGYNELKKDLAIWTDIVQSNRLADQLSFPLHQEGVLSNDNAANRADSFRPKTDFEKELSDLVQTSKHNLNNDVVYTEAELEILKAMDLKEAKERLRRLQKHRVLISYKEAKFRYQKKIKSKGYHRLLKRQKRKQLIKEFDELLVRDPEAAREKLKQLETDRVLERGSLKHNAKSQFRMSVLRRAGKDPAAKKILEEHMRLGKELREKISMETDSESDSDSDEEADNKQSVADLIKSAALAAAKGDTESQLAFEEGNESEKRMKLFEMRAQKREKIAKLKADGTVEKVEKVENVFEENADWNPQNQPVESTSTTAAPTSDASAKKKKKTKKRKLNANEEEKAKPESTASVEDSSSTQPKVKGHVGDVDDIFEQAGEAIISKLRGKIKKGEPNEAATPPVEKKKKSVKEKEPAKEAEPDLVLDPRHFLKVETSDLNKVAADFDDQVTELEDDQSKLIAEAFKDEDVIGDFEKEKERTEEKEKPQDIDLNLQGWGSWAGPGMTARKQRRYIIKAADKKRKDRNKSAVIIKEKPDLPVHKLQPRELPFPYTSVEDYQKAISQPLGKDYNPVTVTKDLCKPAVVTQAGRSIRPMDKEEAIKKKIMEDDETLF